MDAGELELQQQLDAAPQGSGEYLALLNDLATLKLGQGKLDEAQQLYDKVRLLRSTDLAQEAEAASTTTITSREVTKIAQVTAAPADEDEDDWETGWEAGLNKIVPADEYLSACSSPAGTDNEEPSTSRPAPAPRSRLRPTVTPDADDGYSSPSPNGMGAVRDEGGTDHVVEVYGLSQAVKTSHLEAFVDVVCPDVTRKPVVRWVDDHHALIVCPNVTVAKMILDLDQDELQLRPFSQASEASRASSRIELLAPRERPKTTATVAKKLLSHHLGLNQLRDRDGEKALAEQRKVNKEQRRQRQQAASAAWGDDD